MSIVFSGTRSKNSGLIGAISKQIKLVKLEPLKKIIVRFDPFHTNVMETRDFLYYLSSPRVLSTNPSCFIKTKIVCDRSEPLIICNFGNQEKLILQSMNLSTLELLILFNKYVSARIPIIEEPMTVKKFGRKCKK